MNGLSRYSEAEAEARLALAGDVDRAAAWGALAQALLGQGKNHGADAATAKAIAEDPHRASSYYMRAVVLRVMGRLPEAEVAVRKAIELAPAIPFYFAELALILLAVKRTAEALDAVALGLKLDPECLIVCQIYTRALVEAGRLYDGRDNAIRTLSIDPENAASYTQLAQIEFFQNNLADAEKHYRQALRLSPNAQNLRRSLLVILHEQSWLHRTLVAKQDPDTLFQLSIGVFLFWLLIFRGYFRQIVDGDLLPLVGMTACYAASLIMVPIYFRSLYVPLSTLVLSIRPANSALFSRKEILCGQLVTLLLLLGLILLACAGLRHWTTFGPLGVVVLVLCVPITGLFQLGPFQEEGTSTFALTLIIIIVCVVIPTLPKGPALVPLGISAVAATAYASRYIRVPVAPRHLRR